MKKLTSLQFFISKIQKKKISSVLEEKLMQKLEEKALKKSWNNWTARLARAANLARVEGLASKKPTAKPKCVLSVKSHTKHDFSVKIKLPGAYIRRRKKKGKTHRVSKLSSEKIQSLSLSLKGNPLFLSMPHFLTTSHPALSSISL